METIILAGGLGKRLRSAVSDVPKPMAPVNGKPFLAYVLSFLSNQGVSRAVLATGYLHDRIEDYFGTEYQGVKISYSIEREPLGTGGGLLLAMSKLKQETAFVVNGDTFFDVGLQEMQQRHLANGADLTIALKPMRDISRYGVVKFEQDRIVSFEEKKQVASGHINAGVYVVSSTLFREVDLGDNFSFEEDFLKPHLPALRVCPFLSDGYFIDIGVPEDYERAQLEMKRYG